MYSKIWLSYDGECIWVEVKVGLMALNAVLIFFPEGFVPAKRCRLLRAKMFSKNCANGAGRVGGVGNWNVGEWREIFTLTLRTIFSEGHGIPNIWAKTTSTRHKYTQSQGKNGLLEFYLVLVVSPSPDASLCCWGWPFFPSDPYEEPLLIFDMPIAFTINR